MGTFVTPTRLSPGMSAENGEPMRTVFRNQGMIAIPEMNAFSYTMAVMIIPIVIPLIPLLIPVLIYGWLKRQLVPAA